MGVGDDRVYTSHLSNRLNILNRPEFFFLYSRQSEFTVFTELRVSDRKVMSTVIVIITELTGSTVT